MIICIHACIYQGEWEDDKKNGVGRLTLTNGDVYDGDFKDDEYHGWGRLASVDGHKEYEGEWEHGRRMA
jgi:hypothetical protein